MYIFQLNGDGSKICVGTADGCTAVIKVDPQ